MAEQVYTLKKMPGRVPDDLIEAYAQKFLKAVSIGLNDTKGDKGKNEPSGIEAMIEHLRKNVYQFSAAKSYTQMKGLTEALIDAEGKLRTYNQFKAAALQLQDEQVNQWLEAEYNTAMAGSQMAAKWLTIEANKKVFPLLQYVTAHDNRVRPWHAAIDVTVRPVNDAFWDEYYPPNGWNCRCTVKQVGSEVKETPVTEIVHPTEQQVPKIFRFNPGKRQMVFPPDSPYFIGCPKEVLQQALDLLPYDTHFEKLDENIRKHKYVDTSHPEFKNNLLIAKEKAAQGHKVDIMPILHEDNPHRKIIFPDAKKGKSPDLRINGTLHDVKEITTTGNINTIKHAIDEGAKQVDNLIIKLKENVDESILNKTVQLKFKDYSTLQKVEFRYPNGKYKIFINKKQH